MSVEWHNISTDSDRTADGQVAAAESNRRLLGFSVEETAGATAVIRFHSGTTSAGPRLAVVRLTANASVTEWFGPQGIPATNGIFLDVVSGGVSVNTHYI